MQDGGALALFLNRSSHSRWQISHRDCLFRGMASGDT
jgi:hypothetical protein